MHPHKRHKFPHQLPPVACEDNILLSPDHSPPFCLTSSHHLRLRFNDSSQSIPLVTNMQAARRAFRSLRSFTHSARHHPSASEIVSDPIVDDDNPQIPETPEKRRRHPHVSHDVVIAETPSPTKPPPAPRVSRVSSSLETETTLNEHINSSPEPQRTISPQPQTLTTYLNDAQSPRHSKSPSSQLHDSNTPSRDSALPLQTRSQARQNSSGTDGVDASKKSERRKHRGVLDLGEAADRPASPPVKRRRTRSSSRHKALSPDTPEVDELLLRQIVDNATDEERQAILAASASPSGRRKLHKLFADTEEGSSHDSKGQTRNTSKADEIVWLGTSYDSVEEVALTPSPESKREKRPNLRSKISEREGGRKKIRLKLVERIDTSESPERVMRRRSKLGRDTNRLSRARLDRHVENIDSYSSPAPKRRRSRRLTRASELPLEQADESESSSHSKSSAESVVEEAVRRKRTRRGNGKSNSRPLPRPKAGVLRERLQRRMPLLRIKKTSSASRKKKSHGDVSCDTDPTRVGSRRSKRIGNLKARRASIVDIDTCDEVLEEGSADESEDFRVQVDNDDHTIESAEEEEDDEEPPLDDREDDDAEDEESSYNFEEQDWEEQGNRKRTKRSQKRNGRRKRTQPRDVFCQEGEFLTAREQKQRLEFLVKQSEDITSQLHNIMGLASKQSQTTTDGAQPQPTSAAEQGDEKPRNDEVYDGLTRKEEAFVPPSGSGCELQPHQKAGVDWLLTLDAQGLNAILADEMGLGKTIQALSFLASLVISGSRGPHLVIAPKNVCQQWADEARKWYPKELTVVTHLGDLEERLGNLQDILEDDNFDILITSYELAVRDLFTKSRRLTVSWGHRKVLRTFRKVEFEYLVVDEAHRLKNDASKINIAVRNYGLAQRRLLLTGTPLSNNLKELWCLMNVLNPRIFSSKATFEEWFSAPFSSQTTSRSKVSLTHAEKSVIVDRLHTVIRPFFRRRVRADVCPTFTSADEVLIRCPLSGLQRAIILHMRRRATAHEAGINNVIMSMRAASNHPYIVSDALYDMYQPGASEKMVSSSGKFVFLHFALPLLIKNGHRVLIFSQFKRVLDFIEDLLTMLGLKFGRLDGETINDDRMRGLAEFNREGSDIPVYLLTTRAGGIGLNLQTADTVILFDSDWNPSADLQAVSRIQRIGQKRTVHILRLVTENSVDDLIVQTARHKLRTQNVAVGAGKFNTCMGAALDIRMRQRDLEKLLERLEAQNFAQGDGHDSTGRPEIEGLQSLSPQHVNLTAQKRRFEEWKKLLRRKGESSLSAVDSTSIWVDDTGIFSDSDIPHWLAKDADLKSAAKALLCTDAVSARRVYQENLLLTTEAGNLNRKDRASRAKRTVNVIEISDADSENGVDEDKDPTYQMGADPESDLEPEVEPDQKNNQAQSIPQETKIYTLQGASQSCDRSRTLQPVQKNTASNVGNSFPRAGNANNGSAHAIYNVKSSFAPPFTSGDKCSTQGQIGVVHWGYVQQSLAQRPAYEGRGPQPQLGNLPNKYANHIVYKASNPGPAAAGLSVTAVRPAYAPFDHRPQATAAPSAAQRSPLNSKSDRPTKHKDHLNHQQMNKQVWDQKNAGRNPFTRNIQSTQRSNAALSHRGMTSVAKKSQERSVTDLTRDEPFSFRERGQRPHDQLTYEGIQPASSNFCEEICFYDNVLVTENTPSTCAVSTKRTLSDDRGHENEIMQTNELRSSKDKSEKIGRNNVLKSADCGSSSHAVDASVTSKKPMNTKDAQVERLKEMTRVPDLDFLEDALKFCSYDLEAAKRMVMRQMS